MALEPGYYVDKRVIYIPFEGDLTAEVGLALSNLAVELIRSGIPPVHYIADARNLKSLKFNLKQLSEVSTFLREPNLGWVIVLGGSPVARFLSSAIMQMKHQNFHFGDSVEDAMTTLRRVDLNLKEYMDGQQIAEK